MPNRTSKTGSELFIVDNSDADWKVMRYLHDWCQISRAIDIATGYFEIGSLLGLKNEWQKVDQIRILMGDEVTLRTKAAFTEGLARVRDRLDDSLEAEKVKNDFLEGVPAIVEALRSGKIVCRVYRKLKFHAKAYITHARLEVVGSSALVGSSNFTFPGLTENIELNVQITGRPVNVLQEWYEEHWNEAEDVAADILRVIERHTREYTPFEVYAKALYELHRREEPTDQQWLTQQSRVYSDNRSVPARRLPPSPGDRREVRRRLPVRWSRPGQNLCRPDAAGISARKEAQARGPVRAESGAQARVGEDTEGLRPALTRRLQRAGNLQPHRPDAQGQ